MSATVMLSDGALELLCQRLGGQSVEVTASNREAYRELARAGLAVPVSTFIDGPESIFRLTEEAVARRDEFLSQSRRLSASAMRRSIRRAFSRIGK